MADKVWSNIIKENQSNAHRGSTQSKQSDSSQAGTLSSKEMENTNKKAYFKSDQIANPSLPDKEIDSRPQKKQGSLEHIVNSEKKLIQSSPQDNGLDPSDLEEEVDHADRVTNQDQEVDLNQIQL